MKPVMPAALVAALAASVSVPDKAQAQLSGLAMPVIPCSELPAFFRTAPAGATVKITGSCTNMELANRSLPINIIAGSSKGPSATITSLRLIRVQNLNWTGGVIEAIAGLETTNNWQHQRGLSVDFSENIRFSDVHFRRALRAATFARSRNVAVVNSRFTEIRADGINLAEVSGAILDGNHFSDFRPSWSTCWRDGEQIGTSPINKASCVALGGTWRDGDHPDCIQMWNFERAKPLQDILVARNTIFTPGNNNCQALTTHGTWSAERVRFLDNVVRTDSAHGIAVSNCVDCEIRGNRIEGIERFGQPYIMVRQEWPNPGLIACNNTVVTNHRMKLFGTEPCS